MSRLWEVGADLMLVSEAIIDAGGELTPALEAKLDALEGEFDAKVERIALLIREHELEGEKAKTEEQRLRAIRKAHERTADGLKRYVQHIMEATGKLRVDTERARVRVQRNSQPSVIWTGEEGAWPEAYKKLKVELDKRRVLEEWEATSEDPEKRKVPEGFQIVVGTHLRIQ